MQLFFVPVIADEVILDESESHHAVHVLRVRNGDAISLTDGNGTLAHGIIKKADAKGCMVSVTEIKKAEPKPFSLHLAVAPTKNIDRFEWFIEKSAEIGIDRITPLITSRSERKSINEDRLNKLLISACKQSLKSYFPRFESLVRFNEFINDDFENDSKFIAHCHKPDLPLLKDIYKPGSAALILIGPEGDFTEAEIHAAEQKGFTSISLGSSRLRTETAALVACHSINFMNERS